MRQIIKNVSRYIMLVIVVISYNRLVCAQSNQYSVTSFTPVNGIVSSDVSHLFQDSNNYLWVLHAAGVSRYDGHFENFLFSGDARLGRAYCIIEERLDKYWIGADGGLFLIRKNKIQQVVFLGKAMPVYSMAKDGKGGLWIGTSLGPAYLSPAEIEQVNTRPFIDISSRISTAWKKRFLLENLAVKMAIGKTGEVFISDGVLVYHLTEGGISVIWESKRRDDIVTGMVVLGKDSLYFTSSFTGLHCFENGVLSTIENEFGNGNGLTLHNQQLYYYATTGVFGFDIVSHQFYPEVLLPEKFWEWGSCVLVDNENNFWIGTHEKLLQAKKRMFSSVVQPEMEGFNEVYSIDQLRNGDILIGANQGMIFTRSDRDHDFSFRKKIFGQASVRDILEDDEGNIWYGSGYQGIGIDRKGKTEIYTKEDGLRDNTNFFLMYTRSKEIYAGGDNGVTKIVRYENEKPGFKNYFFKTGGSHYVIFKAGVQKPDGSPVFGGDHGLFELVNDSLHPIHILNSSRSNFFVTAVSLDKAGRAWFSTMGDGILICSFEKDGSLKLLKQLGEKEGLSSMIFLDILIDRNQVVWAVGHSGLSRIEKSESGGYFISNFDQTHGYINDNYHEAKMHQDKKGIIWIATSSGLFYFDPADALQLVRRLSVLITNVLDENKASLEKYAEKTEPLNGLPFNTKLPYSVNDLHFEFNSIHLANPSAVQYMFRLIGLDTNWVLAGNSRSATFSNLPPGKYVFEVKAAAGNNLWSKATSYSFSIQPPLWARWWFIVLVILIIAASTLYIIKKREKKIRQREAEKTEFQKLKAISLQYRLEIEQVTGFFATSISKQKSVDDILWDVAKNCISKLGFEDCVIYLKDKERNLLLQKAAWGPKTTEENKIINPIEIEVGKEIVGSLAETAKPAIVNDTTLDSRYIVDDVQRYAEISVPIIQGGEVTGVIDCEHSQKYFYNDKHLQILTTIASLCADRMSKVIAEQQTREKEVEVFKLNQDLATSQLTALRSQMNPHFIFNSLNSIAQLIASKQNEDGLQYLASFSKLLRLVLDESSNNFISLKDEVKILDLYLQLESLRFDGSFNYTIRIDDQLDEEELILPSFLIHPVVENAIWHGLLHKSGERRLIIQFQKKNDEELLCIIKDNGIGIDAALMKKKERLNGEIYPSKGMQLVAGRLALLQQQYGIASYMITEDMKDGDSFNSGTKVTIQLPVIYE